MIKKFNQFLNENTTDYHEVIVPEGSANFKVIYDNHYGYRLYYNNNKFGDFQYDSKYIDLPEGEWKIDKIKDNKVVLKRVI